MIHGARSCAHHGISHHITRHDMCQRGITSITYSIIHGIHCIAHRIRPQHTYINTDIHTHTYIHTHIHTHVHPSIHPSIHTYMHTCVACIHPSMHRHTCVRTPAQALMLTCIGVGCCDTMFGIFNICSCVSISSCHCGGATSAGWSMWARGMGWDGMGWDDV